MERAAYSRARIYTQNSSTKRLGSETTGALPNTADGTPRDQNRLLADLLGMKRSVHKKGRQYE